MPSESKSKKQRLREYLAERNLNSIAEPEWKELLQQLAPVSERYLRQLLRETSIAVAQPYAGIRQRTFAELEESLLEMERVYSAAKARGDLTLAQLCRSAVRQAKDRARLASRNPKLTEEKKAEKAEMVKWMLVWLENPGIFPAWVDLRKKAGSRQTAGDH